MNQRRTKSIFKSVANRRTEQAPLGAFDNGGCGNDWHGREARRV